MAESLQAIEHWQSFWANDGALLSLTYLTPPAHTCHNDRGAYDMIVSRRGIVQASKVTGTLDIPVPGHRRISERVWEAFVVLSRGDKLSNVLTETLAPCGKGSDSQYRMTQVAQLRPKGSLIERGLANITDVIESPGEVVDVAAGAVTDAAGSVAESVGGIAANLVQPLIVPAVLGFLAYQATRQALA